jgi:predicted enzyme related to lactoylglutathione lyase
VNVAAGDRKEDQMAGNGDYSHIEIPADNPDRAVQFYREVFGWQFMTIPGFEDYHLYTTPAGQQGVGGGLGKRGTTAGTAIRNYINVESVAAAEAKVRKAGGKVVLPRTEVMGQGWYSVVTDTEGNEFALWEQDPAARRG